MINTPSSKQPSKYIVLVLLGSLVFAAIFVFVGNKSELIYLKSPACNLNQRSCLYSANHQSEKSLQLHILFDPIPLNNTDPFRLIINQRNKDSEYKVQSIHAQFVGLNMDLETDFSVDQLSEHSFAGQFKLPYCTLKKMNWQLRIEIKTQKKTFRVIEELEVIN